VGSSSGPADPCTPVVTDGALLLAPVVDEADVLVPGVVVACGAVPAGDSAVVVTSLCAVPVLSVPGSLVKVARRSAVVGSVGWVRSPSRVVVVRGR
jgi:predicted ribosome-associated RNA-binding protein Tma20